MKGLVSNIQRFSTHDGPGIRTTIFFQGCPLRCAWCQNPETMPAHQQVVFEEARCINCNSCRDICPQGCFSITPEYRFNSRFCSQCGDCIRACGTGALNWSAKEFSIEDIIRIIRLDAAFYRHSNGGVTLSGGEPLFQYNFCLELAKTLKQEGFHVAIDTSGFAGENEVTGILSIVDTVLFDLKIFNDSDHQSATGQSNHRILKNLQIASQSPVDLIIRVPKIPGLTDSTKNIGQIENWLENISYHHLEFVRFNRLAFKKWEMIGRRCPLSSNKISS